MSFHVDQVQSRKECNITHDFATYTNAYQARSDSMYRQPMVQALESRGNWLMELRLISLI